MEQLHIQHLDSSSSRQISPLVQDEVDTSLLYQTGFGNTFESESIPNALPRGRNNPRLVPYQLFTEQLSGTAFTAPRHENRRTWMYRIQPSVSLAMPAAELDASSGAAYFGGVSPDQCRPEIEALRWKPMPLLPPDSTIDFVTGMKLMCTAGSVESKSGLSIYMYSCSSSMNSSQKYFCNADGDFLIVPQAGGALQVLTELGRLRVTPTEIVVIPRGIVFQINLESPEPARGYVLEIYSKGSGFHLPELGPIGSNGLANARDFYYPTAWCVSDPKEYRRPGVLMQKFYSRLFTKPCRHIPFDVVAWHGNYLPFKYNLQRFCAVNSVSYDHLDPSIYTVLTFPSGDAAGTALADVVLFPPRVMATDSNTFRPPWYHRNTMSEFMGLIVGQYDAKEGFMAGGGSLHVCMTPHGPDAATYSKAVKDPCTEPVLFQGGMAFMFETCLPLRVSPRALDDAEWRDVNYAACWEGLTDEYFTGWDLMRGDNVGREADPVLPLDQNTNSDSVMDGMDDSEEEDDDDESSNLEKDDNFSSVANDGPYQIMVTGAGNEAVNGTYRQDGYFEKACKYVREGLWNENRFKFFIYQCDVAGNNIKHWYISIVPHTGNPGTNSDIDFYTTPVTADCKRVPPTVGWVKADEGLDPAPTVEHHSRP